jgi:hypothetical protein
MKLSEQIWVGLLLLPAAHLWSQVDNPRIEPVPALVGPGNINDPMLIPPPVSGQSYPTSPTSLERSNYLRAGIAFASAYTDNALGSVAGHPVSDVSYSVAPMLALDETTPRSQLVLTYAPGFTFYQRVGSRNEADQNALINFQYRLSPHVTFRAQDNFQKSSNVFNQPDLASVGTISGGAQGPNLSVIAPIADRLSNFGNVGITAQFAANGMVGASGSFVNLHYPNSSEVPGLFDSSSQAGSAFYALRASNRHYVGVTYQYQRLVSYPTEGQNETQTHTVLFFYTLYATSRFSLSLFAGPQHSDTVQPPLPPSQLQPSPSRAWTPAAGASFSWQGRLTSLAASYSHVISSGGGLFGAVQMDSASASIRQHFTRNLGGSLTGGYAQNDVLSSLLLGTNNGHTVSGTASLARQFGEHINLQLGCTRLHQDYSNVTVLSLTPNTNREFVSVSYQFSRPMGR